MYNYTIDNDIITTTITNWLGQRKKKGGKRKNFYYYTVVPSETYVLVGNDDLS